MEVDSAANSAREITDKAAAEDAVAAEEADDRKDLEDSEATTTAAPEAASARSAAAEEEADLPSTGGPINCSYPHITVSHILAPFFNLPFTLFFF